MRILLAVPRRDENLPRKLKADFGSDFEVSTVRDMGWLGKKNGELLELIVFNGFDFFVTFDKNLRYQQNLDKFDISIFLLLAVNNRRDTLQKLVWKVRDIILSEKYSKLNEVV